MVRFRKAPPQEQMDGLVARIGEWRQARRGPGPMPGEIWEADVAMAREFGVCPVARALALDYTALRRRATSNRQELASTPSAGETTSPPELGSSLPWKSSRGARRIDHPHVHLLVFGPDPKEVEAFEAWFLKRWVDTPPRRREAIHPASVQPTYPMDGRICSHTP